MGKVKNKKMKSYDKINATYYRINSVLLVSRPLYIAKFYEH